jgi:hypothetical protein
MLGHPMRLPVLMTLLLLAAPDAFAQHQEVPRTLPVGRLMADAVERTYGCKVNDLHGTLGRIREVKEP